MLGLQMLLLFKSPQVEMTWCMCRCLQEVALRWIGLFAQVMGASVCGVLVVSISDGFLGFANS